MKLLVACVMLMASGCGYALVKRLPPPEVDWHEILILGNAQTAADKAVESFVPNAAAIFPGCQSVQVVEIAYPKGQEMAIAKAIAKDDAGKIFGNVYFFLACTVESCTPLATHWRRVK